MGRRVGVLHHPNSFFPPDLNEAVGPVAELVWVLVDSGAQDRLTQELVGRLGTMVHISSADPDAAAQILREAGVDGVITFVDDHLILAAELATRLGLVGHRPEVAATIANKRRQREALRAVGVPGPRFWGLDASMSPAALRAAAGAVSYPAVLKPAYGSGSRGIVAVRSAQELTASYRPEIEQLVEEHLVDDPKRDARFASYLSVESVVSAGWISHAALTGRFPLADPYRETGNFIPAAVPDGELEELLDVTADAIRALGITDAVVHTEIKLTPEGPRVIELNGRLGGRPPFVLASVSDLNLFQVACRVALGDRVRLPGLASCREVGYWRMIQPPVTASQVADVRGVPALIGSPWVDSATVNRGRGVEIDHLKQGTDAAVVTVRGRVPNLDTLAETIALIDRCVEVDYL